MGIDIGLDASPCFDSGEASRCYAGRHSAFPACNLRGRRGVDGRAEEERAGPANVLSFRTELIYIVRKRSRGPLPVSNRQRGRPAAFFDIAKQAHDRVTPSILFLEAVGSHHHHRTPLTGLSHRRHATFPFQLALYGKHQPPFRRPSPRKPIIDHLPTYARNFAVFDISLEGGISAALLSNLPTGAPRLSRKCHQPNINRVSGISTYIHGKTFGK